ncbi:unnamed protein product [Ectocarpus sp. CCAP 1310/34]|nr:unnamed protein product [Ectocarpus sp. CCAP 1310/34]
MGENYIYHLVQRARWQDAGGDGYLPPTYEADGFIHATKEAGLLLPVANHFYTGLCSASMCREVSSAFASTQLP